MLTRLSRRLRTSSQPEQRSTSAIVQINLMLLIWGILQGLFAVPLILGPFRQVLHRVLTTYPDGSFSFTLSPETLEPVLIALSSGGLLGLMFAGTGLLATLVSVSTLHVLTHGPRLSELGLGLRPGWLGQSVLGLIIGPIVFAAIAVVGTTAGWMQVERGSITIQAFVISLITFGFVAVSEEVLARGIFLQVLERDYGRGVAAIVSSALFSLLHIFNPGISILALVGLFAAGLLFAYAYLATRQLWLPIALHWSWNLSEGPIFGFPVSGLPARGVLGVDILGPDLMTGGAFGPEAGLLGLLGMVIAAWVIAAWQRSCDQRDDDGRHDERRL